VDPAPRRDRSGRVGHRIAPPRSTGAPQVTRPVVLNRRAATRPTITGVERWTAEVLGRLPALAPDRYVVAQPRRRARGRLLAQSWEQVALPVQAARLRASLVFSPANLAPLAWPRNVIVLHDAAVLREPGAYSRTYRAWHEGAGLACARRALGVITVSEFSRRELCDLAGIDARRITVIPGGVDARFEPRADATSVARRLGLQQPYVLSIATADRRKNVEKLAPVAAALRHDGIALVWAGDRRPYFRAAGAASGVRGLGYVPDADLPGLYAGARAFVLPSRYEGFCLTCLEAMACGTPVVAADRAALPETCGDAALLVDPDDEDALVEAVRRAATDPGAGDELRERGRRRAAQFTWEATAARVHELLMRLADAARG
jgi:glycosyltransferase involved in cell wall biosynthesis